MVLKNFERPDAVETCELLCQRVFENGGKVSGLNWTNGELELNIRNCSSQEIIFDMACSVSYKTAVNGFEVKLPVQENDVEVHSDKACSRNFVNMETFLTLLREELETSGASVQTVLRLEKKGGSSQVIFLVAKEHLKESLRRLELVCNSCFFHETGFSLYVTAAGCFVQVLFQEGVISHSSVSSVSASCTELFEAECTPELRIRAFTERQKLIGSITRSDGTVLIFYKNPDGQILSEKGA